MPVDEHAIGPRSTAGPTGRGVETAVRVRFWASARSAAGTSEVEVTLAGATTVAELRRRVVEALPGRPALPRVLEVCTVLVGEEPVHDDTAQVPAGATVEFLPPFAGG